MKLWARVGVTFDFSDEEIKAVLDDSNCEGMADAIKTAVTEGRFELDGNTYIPCECIEEFNKEYGTAYSTTGEPECEL